MCIRDSLNHLQMKMMTVLKRMKDVIRLEVEKRFGSVEINDLHTSAIYLDSRYKASFLVTILEQVKSLLCVAVEKLQSEQSINSPPIKRKKQNLPNQHLLQVNQ